MQTFVAEIPLNDPAKMEEFQQVMNAIHDETNEYIQNLAKELGVSEGCAADVWYLRTRSRHTPELEQILIELHKAGTPPNMCEFGNVISLEDRV